MHFSTLFLTAMCLASQVFGLPTANEDSIQKPLIKPNSILPLDPIRDALASNKVIGDVLDDFAPSYYIDVVYTQRNARVFLGNELSVEDVKKRPRFTIRKIPNHGSPSHLEADTFTLVLTDPDATSRYNPVKSEMCHWIITNITVPTHGDGSLEGAIELDLDEDYAFQFHPEEDFFTNKHKNKNHGCKADNKGGKCLPGELESYYAPAPPAATGWHRYVFVLLVGDATRLHAPKEREHWGYGKIRHGIRDWSSEYGLEVVGANLFFAMNEQQ